MNVYKGESTRDIICLTFGFGTRSYQQEIEHLYKMRENVDRELLRAKCKFDSYQLEKIRKKKAKIKELFVMAHKNKNKYNKMSKDDLRLEVYKNGIDVEYVSCNRNGDIKKRETIHYKMLYRSTGKAKKGTCMFINETLYDKAINYLRMGIELDDNNPMIVEISAYSSLISSGIVDTVTIDPDSILILKDVDRYFKTNVISIEIDENKHCISKHIDNYSLKNTLFDGQALIDTSIFPTWGNGYILLRQHFCKMAAFHTNIQKFFQDYFGDQYDEAYVTDMWGRKIKAKNVKLITTDNAIKWKNWSKFGIDFDYWASWIRKDGCRFGIVKTAHPSKMYPLQRMSYQMINSLNLDIMGSVVKENVEYIERLKYDDDFFIEYLKKNDNFSNDYKVLVALCEHNPDFIRSSYFRKRRRDIIGGYTLKFKSGEIINNGENLTVCGSPYALLLYAASGNPDDVDKDDTFYCEDGTIQCYTERFNSNEYLAFFRSPFNSKNNLVYLHNVYHKNLEKYFYLGEQCIAVNVIGTDIQDRANGMDFDADFAYTTNLPEIVEHAKRCYIDYPTIVNNIPKESKTYINTIESFAIVDNILAKSQLDIGSSSNLAQIAQTYSYCFDNYKYDDYAAILATIAQVSIDNSKRTFDINVSEEIKRIKEDLNVSENKYPEFWRIIKHGFNKNNINKNLSCPMNYLCDLNLNSFKQLSPTLPMSYFFIKHPLEKDKKQCRKVEDLITNYSLEYLNVQIDKSSDYDDWLLLKSSFDDLIRDIQKVYISSNYKDLMSWLIDRAFEITPSMKRNKNIVKSKLSKNRTLLLKVLFSINEKSFLECFSKKFSTPLGEN